MFWSFRANQLQAECSVLMKVKAFYISYHAVLIVLTCPCVFVYLCICVFVYFCIWYHATTRVLTHGVPSSPHVAEIARVQSIFRWDFDFLHKTLISLTIPKAFFQDFDYFHVFLDFLHICLLTDPLKISSFWIPQCVNCHGKF